VKRQVFSELRDVVSPECALATNTSSLSVAEMGADLGIHFFNPVAVMPLVELVRHADTDDAKLATAWDVVSKLRKRAVLVTDTPGFVVNRVLTRMTRVLMDALEHGTPSEVVDEAILRLGLAILHGRRNAVPRRGRSVGARLRGHVRGDAARSTRMKDDWRLRIDFPDPEGIVDRLRHAEARELVDELRGHRLAVTRDDDTVFVYAPNRLQAEQAQALVEGEVGGDGEVMLEQWLADEERWSSEPPRERAEEELLERGFAPWEVHVEARSREEAERLAEELRREGYSVT